MSTTTIALLTCEERAEVLRRLDRWGLSALAGAVRAGDRPELAAVIGRPLLAWSEEDLAEPWVVLAYLEELPDDDEGE